MLPVGPQRARLERAGGRIGEVAAEGPAACLFVRMLNLCASLTPKRISTCYLAIWKDWHTVEFWLKTEW